MSKLKRSVYFAAAFAMVTMDAVAVGAIPKKPAVIASIDLSKSFDTRSAWRFVATQGTSVDDPNYDGQSAPGAVHVCMGKGDAGSCDASLSAMLRSPSADSDYNTPHSLNKVQVYHPKGPSGPALLFVQLASLHAADGDQLVRTQVLAYRRGPDRFFRIYDFITGRNNNQGVRYIESGPLKGDIISVQPTQHAPFGFWVTVNALSPNYTYRQALRYRSATLYGDGNPLAVVDSEMPNIEQRLGLWRPGFSLPAPAGPCPKPHLVHMELWCA